MIRRGWEIAIFIIVFIVVMIIGDIYLVNVKASLPINTGKSIEEVIETSYPELVQDDLRCEYRVDNDYLLLYRETVDGSFEFEVGYQNGQSGYILELPGFIKGDIYTFKSFEIEMGHRAFVSVHVYKYPNSDYVLELTLIGEDGNIEFFDNGIRIEPFVCKATGESKTILVIDEISANTEISCIYKDEEIYLINNQELEALLGGQR